MNSFLEKTPFTVHLPQWYSSFSKASQRRSLSPDHNQRGNHVFVHPSILVLHPLDAQVDHPMNSKTMSDACILVFACHCPPPPSWRHAYRRLALNPRLSWKSSMHASPLDWIAWHFRGVLKPFAVGYSRRNDVCLQLFSAKSMNT